MSGYPGKVSRLAFDDSGRWLAADGAPDVTIWDFAGKGPHGSSPRMLRAHDTVTALTWRPAAPPPWPPAAPKAHSPPGTPQPAYPDATAPPAHSGRWAKRSPHSPGTAQARS